MNANDAFKLKVWINQPEDHCEDHKDTDEVVNEKDNDTKSDLLLN